MIYFGLGFDGRDDSSTLVSQSRGGGQRRRLDPGQAETGISSHPSVGQAERIHVAMQRSKRSKTQCLKTFQSSACLSFANISLARAIHMGSDQDSESSMILHGKRQGSKEE